MMMMIDREYITHKHTFFHFFKYVFWMCVDVDGCYLGYMSTPRASTKCSRLCCAVLYDARMRKRARVAGEHVRSPFIYLWCVLTLAINTDALHAVVFFCSFDWKQQHQTIYTTNERENSRQNVSMCVCVCGACIYASMCAVVYVTWIGSIHWNRLFAFGSAAAIAVTVAFCCRRRRRCHRCRCFFLVYVFLNRFRQICASFAGVHRLHVEVFTVCFVYIFLYQLRVWYTLEFSIFASFV